MNTTTFVLRTWHSRRRRHRRDSYADVVAVPRRLSVARSERAADRGTAETLATA